MVAEIYTTFYNPKGVSEFLGLGTDSFIGVVDKTTVLKFPRTEGDKAALAVLDLEAEILRTIGPHPCIIGFKGQRDDGILLEHAVCGSIAQFLRDHTPTWQQKFSWICQATEAVAVTHRSNVIHCDINVNNILLDEQLNVKLCDFQGFLLRPDGSVDKDGLARENIKSSMPRADPNHADRLTDIFALGSAFYYITQGHEPFPDLDSFRDEEQIVARFASHQFPQTRPQIMNRVIHKCWAGQYGSAEAVLQDLSSGDRDVMDAIRNCKLRCLQIQGSRED